MTEDYGKLTEDYGRLREADGKMTEDYGKMMEDYGKMTGADGRLREDDGRLRDARGPGTRARARREERARARARGKSRQVLLPHTANPGQESAGRHAGRICWRHIANRRVRGGARARAAAPHCQSLPGKAKWTARMCGKDQSLPLRARARGGGGGGGQEKLHTYIHMMIYDNWV